MSSAKKQRLLEDIEKAATDVLENEPLIEAAYLFGSHAKGKARLNSDIDIAVLFKEDIRDSQRIDTQQELFRRLFHALDRSDIDIVCLNRASLLLRHRAIREGIVIKGVKSQQRVSFHRDSIIEYLDTIPLRNELIEGTKHALEEGRFG